MIFHSVSAPVRYSNRFLEQCVPKKKLEVYVKSLFLIIKNRDLDYRMLKSSIDKAQLIDSVVDITT